MVQSGNEESQRVSRGPELLLAHGWLAQPRTACSCRLPVFGFSTVVTLEIGQISDIAEFVDGLFLEMLEVSKLSQG